MRKWLYNLGVFSGVWTILRAIWGIVGHWGNLQTAWDVVKDWPEILRLSALIVSSWWFPLSVSLACLASWWLLTRRQAANHAKLAGLSGRLDTVVLPSNSSIEEDEFYYRIAQMIAGGDYPLYVLHYFKADELKSNDDLVRLCDRLVSDGHKHPFDIIRHIVSEPNWLSFLKNARARRIILRSDQEALEWATKRGTEQLKQLLEVTFENCDCLVVRVVNHESVRDAKINSVAIFGIKGGEEKLILSTKLPNNANAIPGGWKLGSLSLPYSIGPRDAQNFGTLIVERNLSVYGNSAYFAEVTLQTGEKVRSEITSVTPRESATPPKPDWSLAAS